MVQEPGFGMGACFWALIRHSTLRTITRIAVAASSRKPISTIINRTPAIDPMRPIQNVLIRY